MRELRVPEVGLARAGGDDQAVVGYPAAATDGFDRETARVEIDGDDLAEHDRRVLLVAQDVADRRRDVALGEYARRELIQQRLEQVMVGPVDDCDIEVGGAPQLLRGEEPAEPASDDRHPVAANSPAFHLVLLVVQLSVQAPGRAQARARRPARPRASP